MRTVPEGTQFIEAGCGEKGFRKFEEGSWWFFEGFWRRVDWKMGALTLVTEHTDYAAPTPLWTGEGLPPVGIEIEAFMMSNMHDTYEWRRAKVVHGGIPGSDREILVFDLESTAPAWVDEFRPIRTPGQIAAEEREAAIQEIFRVITAADNDIRGQPSFSSMAEALHQAGYRKQVAP